VSNLGVSIAVELLELVGGTMLLGWALGVLAALLSRP
jgi:hypothetical protein